MTNEAYFYWVGWMLWITTTFFMKRGKKRDLYTVWLLSILILSNTNVMIGEIEYNTSLFLLIIGSFILLLHLKRQIYLTICTFTIMLGYASLLFWEKAAPIWLFWPREVLVPLLLSLTALLLVRGLESRLCVVLLGTSFGECVFSFTLSSYGLSRGTGELPFLGNIMIAIVFIAFLDIIRKSRTKKAKHHNIPIDLEVAK
ncbi:hypothetical protein [Oceanobacillus jordanicus]|uniref:DUF5668 domain-containing protein n=1 Tax=Oceanobacillus jordanicus TaxID=2867266 RepID=A0AAW5B6E8_9BACI|nr:hypothetical protein [Oceanobacillus jordanicus]MCG3418832.1 hypothetical protein [Oceanobacillus jordanicus]